MRKEEELIRLLALGIVDQEWPGKVTAILRKRLDWEYIISSAGLEGVSGFIYDRLKKNQLDRFVPKEILIGFESIYYTYSAQNILFYRELSRVAAALEQGKVPAILLKGVFLASVVYENIALRPMRDLDLLVRKDDVLSAVEILGRSGYEAVVPAEEQLKSSFNYSVTLSKKNTSLSIDLHWHIFNASWLMGLSSAKCDIKDLWASAETANIEGVQARVLSPEYLLISLAINAFTHCCERMILLVDLAQVLKKYKDRIDLRSVYEKAKACRLDNILGYTLKLVPKTAYSGRGAFRRKYHYSRPLILYILTQKGLLGKFQAFFEVSLVITRFLFKRLERKKT